MFVFYIIRENVYWITLKLLRATVQTECTHAFLATIKSARFLFSCKYPLEIRPWFPPLYSYCDLDVKQARTRNVVALSFHDSTRLLEKCNWNLLFLTCETSGRKRKAEELLGHDHF